jgi:hypothetical protein
MWWGDETQEEAPKEPKYKRLNELPEPVRAEFEAFIRTEWRKIKREEIRSLHRFLEKSADFQNWWQKFQQKPAAEPQTDTKPEPQKPAAEPQTDTKPEPQKPGLTPPELKTENESKRTFAPMPEEFKGFFKGAAKSSPRSPNI